MSLADDIKDLIEHDNSRARRLLHAVVDEAPRSVEGLYLLARSYLRSMEVATALPHYLSVLKLDPTHVEAMHASAYCRMALGDTEGALKAYRDAFAAAATAHSMYMCALLLHRLGRIDESIDAYQRVLSTCQPTSVTFLPALHGMAAAQSDANRPLEADHYFHELKQKFLRNPAKVALHIVDRSTALDFHEWWHYEDKSRLAASLQRFAKASPGLVRFPETFILPAQRDLLAAYAARHDRLCLIAKPAHGTGGQGILVTDDVGAVIDRSDIVVQRYLDRPYLIDGRKGHARIYGLIASTQPLQAYIYRDGIVRFAPERYDRAAASLRNNAIHVTNTALHRGHPALVVATDTTQANVGSIWSLAAFLDRMTSDGRDGDAAFGKIKALVEGFVRMLAVDGLLERQTLSGPARGFGPKLFGLDVLIDDDGEPWLIEMQAKPALGGAPLVEKINGELCATILRMSTGPLLEDGMPRERVARLMVDEKARRQREREILTAHRGAFAPLAVG